MKRAVLLAALISLSVWIGAQADSKGANDWRKTANTEDKVERLVKVMPGASNLMLQLGDRYRNLYWAAKQDQWEFAEYQAEEMKDLVETLQITRPKRAATAQEFLDASYPAIIEAAGSGDRSRFGKAFADLRAACMDCHVKNDHAFIVLPKAPRSAPSPVFDLE